MTYGKDGFRLLEDTYARDRVVRGVSIRDVKSSNLNCLSHIEAMEPIACSNL